MPPKPPGPGYWSRPELDLAELRRGDELVIVLAEQLYQVAVMYRAGRHNYSLQARHMHRFEVDDEPAEEIFIGVFRQSIETMPASFPRRDIITGELVIGHRLAYLVGTRGTTYELVMSPPIAAIWHRPASAATKEAP